MPLKPSLPGSAQCLPKARCSPDNYCPELSQPDLNDFPGTEATIDQRHFAGSRAKKDYFLPMSQKDGVCHNDARLLV
jgi:hypothetical protein